MAEPSLALHKALLAALNTTDWSIYDAVPQGAALPYITVDTSISANDDYLSSRRDERLVTLTCWSEQRGQAQVLEMMQDIDEALHELPLTLDTGQVVSVRVDRKNTRRDADNVTFMGNVSLRIITRH